MGGLARGLPPTSAPVSVVQTSVSGSAPPLSGSTDSPGGPSPPPGSVTSANVPPPPMRSSMPVVESPPQLNVTDSEYRYETVAGNYSFPVETPFLVRYSTTEGDRLVNASTFVVLSPGISLFNNATILSSTAHRYSVRYDYSVGVILSGNITITFDFRDDGPPKITVVRAQSLGGLLPLTWATFTTDTVASNGSALVNFGSVPQPVNIRTPNFHLSIGPDQDPANWTRSLVVDWNDAGAGAALAGRIAIGTLQGAAALVVFPVPLATIDPILAGTSTVVTATTN